MGSQRESDVSKDRFSLQGYFDNRTTSTSQGGAGPHGRVLSRYLSQHRKPASFGASFGASPTEPWLLAARAGTISTYLGTRCRYCTHAASCASPITPSQLLSILPLSCPPRRRHTSCHCYSPPRLSSVSSPSFAPRRAHPQTVPDCCTDLTQPNGGADLASCTAHVNC
ncbi:hypothetical protein K402DRAFT_111652 [Aulographum hederae CBS 113979]|uniref:Uncharacterized protein n=1 Tax=Aulographum hederae CBS 113979 TaxID=1176131 RepID=A0A6G1GW49_9PEZI|nr:hypothetical protein K402DRAFT_111652 [Aulographum hederae CBS 113979]